MYSIEEVKSRLDQVRPEIEKLMKIGGTPGAAIGVLHHGQLAYLDNIGFRDVSSKLPVTNETIFPCASLTKAILSAAMAICVEEGGLSWDTPVQRILPEFHTRDELLHYHMTVSDCLCHRAGMQASPYWLGSMNNVLISNENSMNFINDLQRIRPFPDQYLYNNLGYEIAAHIIARVTGDPWERVLHTKIFKALDMGRTGTRFGFIQDDNVAKAYATLDDASPVEIVPMLSGDNTVGGPGSAMRSCMKDLLRRYSSLLDAGNHQTATGRTSTPGNPFKQARVQTPGPMGAIGLNPDLLSPKPVPDIAKNHPSQLVLYHQGSMPGNLAAVNLVPKTSGAIVVLTNSLALNDTADWIGQMLLEAYLGVEDITDYVSLSKETVKSVVSWYARILQQLKEQQIPGTSPRPLAEYVGTYYNYARTMMIQIIAKAQEKSLFIKFQGLDSEEFILNHYHYDNFTWLEPRNNLARRGRFTNTNADYFKISFGTDGGHRINHLTWQHDKELPKPESFYKEN
ncbi:uncharacterized protein K452DRAFT_306921 [Aplosporella prunicola CBS 121167]|uniref:Beta-lactamase-related domain-containing protein n=1 Tax=Aplosporella prunicola CBS 121167 TaxID=1176127 RepID=A0A6A6BJP4_9PEZI|nr:uncharacterized protein K452DRAFT_306921 [Aplosporella prunicola CBS 121167]KAF2144342.1 hypothetical protein K452DRAFT_306921 [Aplosporella prunicola CBS 121167]